MPHFCVNKAKYSNWFDWFISDFEHDDDVLQVDYRATPAEDANHVTIRVHSEDFDHINLDVEQVIKLRDVLNIYLAGHRGDE